MRHFLRPLFFFVILLSLAPAWAPAQEVVSTWWYPLGNPQGTLRNPEATKSQRENDLVIKWRAPQLAGSPTTLVGGIQSLLAERRQQIVGAHGDSIIILSDLGLLQNKVPYSNQGLSNAFTLTLTGLFNPATPSVNARGLPTRIGIGIERRQRNSPADPTTFPLVAYLADRQGIPSETITIDPLPDDPDLNNQSAGIYPVAAYASSVLVAVSQNTFQRSTGTLANSIRKYNITGANATLRWSYPVAPRTYAQHPALLADPARPEVQRIALSTSSYPPNVQITANPPVPGQPTRTDKMYSIQVLDNTPPPTPPVHANTLAVPLPPSQGNPQGEANSYFIVLSESPGSEENFLLVTSNYSQQQRGRPEIWLTPATPDATNRDRIYASYAPTRLLRDDLGLKVAAADVDREAQGRTITDAGFSYYPGNPGDELLVAYDDPARNELAENYLYVLRRREASAIGDSIPLDPFIQYKFQGRLMGAGDLVKGDAAREEVVIAHRNTVSILQLRNYNDDAFNMRGDPLRDFFRVVRSFTLDADVVSVAIADVEGDEENDLIVNTTQSTYAIGLKATIPFGTIKADEEDYCPGSDVKVRWSRRIGGGQDGVRVVLLRDNDPVRTLAYRHRSGSIDVANPGTGPDSITFSTQGLAPGTYRVSIEDTVVTSLRDIGEPFVILQPAITEFTADAGATPVLDNPVHLAAHVTCAESVQLLRSYDGSQWDTLGTYLTISTADGERDSATAFATLQCPPAAECGGAESVEIRFRFRDPVSRAESGVQVVTIPIPARTVELEDPTSPARRRTIRWSAADYGCTELAISLTTAQGNAVPLASGISADLEEFTFEVPDQLSETLRVQLCCASGTAPSCTYGRSVSFEIPELPPGNYVAPNPFNPVAASPAGGAVIVYRLERPATVTATIYDASRSIVRRLVDGSAQDAGRRKLLWDGRNSRGDIVGAGTYICIIEQGSEQPIVLPIIVAKH